MKVKAGSIYIFQPSFMDVAHRITSLQPGEIVRVINLPSAPKANTMGQCHVERVSLFCDLRTKRSIIQSLGFAGMVATASLEKANLR